MALPAVRRLWAGRTHPPGPADDAPLVLRGKALRQSIIIRLLAVERLFPAVLLGLAVWAVLAFRRSQNSIQAAFDRNLPAFRNVGIHVDQLSLVQDLQKALNQAPGATHAYRRFVVRLRRAEGHRGRRAVADETLG